MNPSYTVSGEDFFPPRLKNYRDSQRLKKRASVSLHLGNIIQIPQRWIFDDAGKGKRARRGDRVRENGVRANTHRERNQRRALFFHRDDVALTALP